MWNVKTECEKVVMYKKRKKEINYFVLHKNEILFYFILFYFILPFFWHVSTFFLLHDNKNISAWHNIIYGVARKKKVCVKTKCFTLHKK